MKIFFLLIFSFQSYALPVLNDLYPNNDFLTLFKDHQKKDVVYSFPVGIRIKKNRELGGLHFKYKEYRKRLKKKAIIQTLLKLDYYQDNLHAFKSRNSEIKVLPISFTEAKINFGKVITPYIDSQECHREIGQGQSVISCELVLSSKGIKRFRKILQSEFSLLIYANFKMEFLIKDDQGNFMKQSSKFSVSSSLNDVDFYHLSEVFLDHKGNEIFTDKPIPIDSD